MDSHIHLLQYSAIYSFFHFLCLSSSHTHSLAHLLTLTHSLNHLPTHPPTHLSINSPTHPPFTHSLAFSHTYSRTYPLTHQLTQDRQAISNAVDDPKATCERVVASKVGIGQWLLGSRWPLEVDGRHWALAAGGREEWAAGAFSSPPFRHQARQALLMNHSSAKLYSRVDVCLVQSLILRFVGHVSSS